MLFDRGEEGEEEMRRIIDYSGEKSFVRGSQQNR